MKAVTGDCGRGLEKMADGVLRTKDEGFSEEE
jgi:hypothetical protein